MPAQQQYSTRRNAETPFYRAITERNDCVRSWREGTACYRGSRRADDISHTALTVTGSSRKRRRERERERRKEARFARWIVIFNRSRSLAFTLPTSLRWWCDHKPERVWWWWCVCVCACVRVCVCCCCGGLDCADGVFFVTSLNPAAHYLGLCLCTFLSAVGAVRSITSHGNLLQHADCSRTDRRVCVCERERGVFVCVQSTPLSGELHLLT